MELEDIQARIREMFGEEDKASGPLLLTSVLAEETGELAKAVRGKGDVAEEAADVIFITLSIANLFDVNISKALEKKYLSRSKEEISEGWKDVPWK